MRRPQLGADRAGAAYIEFIITFVPLFTLFLAGAQLGLLHGARLIVQHSAYRGARAAAVIVDDDPKHYGDSPRGCLRQACEDSTDDDDGTQAPDSPRMAAIRRAVHTPLATLAPPPAAVARFITGDLSLAHALQQGPGGLLSSALGYLGMTTAVTFPRSAGSQALQEAQIPPDAPFSVRVTHLFVCRVPIAAALVCSELEWDDEARHPAHPDGATDPTLAELVHAPDLSSLRPHLHLARFKVLQAEARMLNHSAWYAYEAADKDTAP